MIHYSLRCDRGHDFDSWFASAAAYDRLADAGHVACAVCGSTAVDKAPMAPAVALRSAQPLSERSAVEEHLAALRRHVEENSDYVGQDFVTEARAMHLGEVPERPIWGEARMDEAKALLDEGVPVAPLPFVPKTRAN